MKSIERGLREELKWSRFFHEKGVAVLVSPDLLRKRGMGQVDLCFFKKKRGKVFLEVVEVKSSSFHFFSHKQRRRVLNSCSFLSKVFNIPSCLSFSTSSRF